MLQSGNNQNAKSSVAPVGVLQCASNSCKLRVIGASTWNCCKACSASNGTAHDKECLQVPLEGYATRYDWLCSQGIAKRSFTTRLRALLEKQGPLHISELPYAWNATYGEASWVEDRPVRSASKACSPPHVTGIKIVNGVVYAVEELVAGDMHSHMIQTDDEFLKHLSAEAAHLIDLEFEAVVAGYEVTTAFASLVGTSSSTWLASITRCAVRFEQENDGSDRQREEEDDEHDEQEELE